MEGDRLRRLLSGERERERERERLLSLVSLLGDRSLRGERERDRCERFFDFLDFFYLIREHRNVIAEGEGGFL